MQVGDQVIVKLDDAAPFTRTVLELAPGNYRGGWVKIENKGRATDWVRVCNVTVIGSEK